MGPVLCASSEGGKGLTDQWGSGGAKLPPPWPPPHPPAPPWNLLHGYLGRNPFNSLHKTAPPPGGLLPPERRQSGGSAQQQQQRWHRTLRKTLRNSALKAV